MKMKKCGGMTSVRKLVESSQGADVVTPPTIIPPLASIVANEATTIGDVAFEVYVEAIASVVTPSTTYIDDVASMGADDDVHLVDGGGYPNAEASKVVVEALASMVTRSILPPVAVVLANETTAFSGDVASMGAGDDVHLVDDGRYMNAYASEVTVENLVSLEQPLVGATPFPDANECQQGNDSGC